MTPSIGIMQGRLLPERLDRLQVFPMSKWKEELTVAGQLGFNCFELLYDKEMILSSLMEEEDNYQDLGLCSENGVFDVKSTSVCLDCLAEIALITEATSSSFLNELKRAMYFFKNSSIDVLVIPFCDKNEIMTANDLRCALIALENSGLDKLAADFDLLLSLELTLPADIIVDEFSVQSFANIGICFDLGNIRSAGFQPEVEIIKLGGLINHVHIKDRLVGGPNVMLGMGEVDFKACFKSLRKSGYSGRFILETRYFVDPLKEASLNLNYLESVVD
ncbi:sugar phosphate isomerase/epimerase [archaeon]|jgi:L-ribulose-5-phosphate 3-epimerase|nr:sugar phosphate isomerase/epimerase [archaeon]